MLKKELCKKCHQNLFALGWVESDEIRWEERWVICPDDYVEREENRTRYITAQPPTNCPFLLEHVLSKED